MSYLKRLITFSIFGAATVLAFQNCGKANGFRRATQSSESPFPIPAPWPSPQVSPSVSPGTTPNAPSQLVATAQASDRVKLAWVSNSNRVETQFIIERQSPIPFGGGTAVFAEVDRVDQQVTEYIDSKSLNASTNYTYRVLAINGTLKSDPTSNVAVTTPAAPGAPPSPASNLVATAAAATIINLSWSDNSNNESYFRIMRSTGGGTPVLAGTASTDTTTFRDINLNPLTTYTYHVVAVNFAGAATPTADIGATTMAAGATNTFTYVYTNIIEPNCVGCHGAALQAAGFRYDGYGNASTGTGTMLNAMNSDMPPGQPLTQTQINQVQSWVNAGAPND